MNDEHKCEKCGETLIIDGWELVCPKCGLVCPQPFFEKRVWHDDHRGVLTTGIPTNNYTPYALNSFKILKTLCEKFNLPRPVRLHAEYIFKCLLADKKKLHITNYIYLAAISLILATRQYKQISPIPVTKVIESFQKIGYSLRKKTLMKNMGRIMSTPNGLRFKNIVMPREYVRRIIAELQEAWYLDENLRDMINSGIMDKVKIKAELMLKNIKEKGVRGKNPYILAISAVYLASRDTDLRKIITEKLLAKKFKIHETTIRDYNRIIRENT